MKISGELTALTEQVVELKQQRLGQSFDSPGDIEPFGPHAQIQVVETNAKKEHRGQKQVHARAPDAGEYLDIEIWRLRYIPGEIIPHILKPRN